MADNLLEEAVLKLRAAAQIGGHVEAAQMQLINLSEVVASAGLGGPKLMEKIRSGSMNFLRGCLSDDDIVIPCGDGFLIIFADASAADRKTRELRELLFEFYLGQKGLEQLRVEAARDSLSARTLRALTAGESSPVRTATADSGFMFAPIWHASRQAIVAYFCTPVNNADAEPCYAYHPSFLTTGVSDGDDYLETDLLALEHVRACLASTPGAAPPFPIGVPVHATTLQRNTRRAIYLKRFGELAGGYPSLASVRISEITTGVPISTIAEWVGQFRPYVRFVYLQFHHAVRPPLGLEQSGAAGAGFWAPPQLMQQGEPEPFVHRHLSQWAAALAEHCMVFFVDNVRSRWIIEHGAQIGIRLITSTLIGQAWSGRL